MNNTQPRSDPSSPSLSEAQLPDNSIRPLIVDDHEATRLGTALILQREPWVARCLLAADGLHAAELAARRRPEVALLDISNAGPFAASATGRLLEAHPRIAIVLTSRCHLTLRGGPRAVGASALVPAGSAAHEIVTAVRAAILSIDHQAPPPDQPELELSERDRDLLLLISEGATNREIANRLHLGPDTVKKSASALYRKLGVRNRTQAAQRAAHLFSPNWPPKQTEPDVRRA
jgi:DNA-binding NarL/FixJ family response regulator